MSAPTRITAEPGRLYLMQDGEYVRVLSISGNIVSGYGSERAVGLPGQWPRSIFETAIESVLE